MGFKPNDQKVGLRAFFIRFTSKKLLTFVFHPMPLFQWTGQKHVYPDY